MGFGSVLCMRALGVVGISIRDGMEMEMEMEISGRNEPKPRPGHTLLPERTMLQKGTLVDTSRPKDYTIHRLHEET